jgi:hypothetical protein
LITYKSKSIEFFLGRRSQPWDNKLMNHQKQMSNASNKSNGYMNDYYASQRGQPQSGIPNQSGIPTQSGIPNQPVQQPGQSVQQPSHQSPTTNQSNHVLPPPLSYYNNQQPSQQPTNQPSSTNINNSNIASKFTNQDIQILRQLLIAGEKHKWKQITKEINQLSPNNAMHYRSNRSGSRDGSVNPQPTQQSAGQSASADGSPSSTSAKNVSPTFVIKQYQSLLGLPNNALYFGSLGSSLPYVVANNGWEDLNYEYPGHFGDIE